MKTFFEADLIHCPRQVVDISIEHVKLSFDRFQNRNKPETRQSDVCVAGTITFDLLVYGETTSPRATISWEAEGANDHAMLMPVELIVDESGLSVFSIQRAVVIPSVEGEEYPNHLYSSISNDAGWRDQVRKHVRQHVRQLCLNYARSCGKS